MWGGRWGSGCWGERWRTYLTACRRWKAGPGPVSKHKLPSPGATIESGKDGGRVGRIRRGPTAPRVSGVSFAEATLCSESPAPRVLISARLHPCGGRASQVLLQTVLLPGAVTGGSAVRDGLPSLQAPLPPSLYLLSFSGLPTAGLSLTTGGALFWRVHQPRADRPGVPTTLRLGGLCSGPLPARLPPCPG